MCWGRLFSRDGSLLVVAAQGVCAFDCDFHDRCSSQPEHVLGADIQQGWFPAGGGSTGMSLQMQKDVHVTGSVYSSSGADVELRWLVAPCWWWQLRCVLLIAILVTHAAVSLSMWLVLCQQGWLPAGGGSTGMRLQKQKEVTVTGNWFWYTCSGAHVSAGMAPC
jgi:hypothetical protein